MEVEFNEIKKSPPDLPSRQLNLPEGNLRYRSTPVGLP
jgi:hypothetical protein